MKLLQRINGVQGLPGLDEFPVSSEFVLMQIVPIEYCRQCPPRKSTLDDTGIYVDGDFMLAILRVEMRRRMVSIVHPNNDSEESADFWHRSSR
jgi:hypothetical protein